MMRNRLLALLLAVIASAPVAAQKDPTDVTDAQLEKYKASSEAECRAGAAGKGDPKDIAAFCGCIFTSLNGSMTRAEWQQAYLYSTKSDPAHVREVLDPHLQKADCRPQAAPAPAPAPAAKPELAPSDAKSGSQRKSSQGLKAPVAK